MTTSSKSKTDETKAETPAPAEAPKVKLTPAQRLQKQLDEAIAKEKAGAQKKLDAAKTEQTKAEKDVERANARLAKVKAEVAELENQIGNDPIVTAETAAALEAEGN